MAASTSAGEADWHLQARHDQQGVMEDGYSVPGRHTRQISGRLLGLGWGCCNCIASLSSSHGRGQAKGLRVAVSRRLAAADPGKVRVPVRHGLPLCSLPCRDGGPEMEVFHGAIDVRAFVQHGSSWMKLPSHPEDIWNYLPRADWPCPHRRRAVSCAVTLRPPACHCRRCCTRWHTQVPSESGRLNAKQTLWTWRHVPMRPSLVEAHMHV